MSFFYVKFATLYSVIYNRSFLEGIARLSRTDLKPTPHPLRLCALIFFINKFFLMIKSDAWLGEGRVGVCVHNVSMVGKEIIL